MIDATIHWVANRVEELQAQLLTDLIDEAREVNQTLHDEDVRDNEQYITPLHPTPREIEHLIKRVVYDYAYKMWLGMAEVEVQHDLFYAIEDVPRIGMTPGGIL